MNWIKKKIGNMIINAKSIISLIFSIGFLAGGLVLVNFLVMFSVLSSVTNYVSYAIGIGIGILIYKTGGFQNTDTKKITDLNNEIETLRKENDKNKNIGEKVERLQNQKISITQLEDIFKISLFKIKTIITDFKKEPIGENKEFVSVIQQDLELNYGINFKNIKIIDNDTNVCIYNLQPKFTGFGTHPKYKKLFAEIRETYDNKILKSNDESTLKINGKRTDSIKVDSKKQNDLLSCLEQHETELHTRIENGSEEFLWLEKPIKEKAELLLKLIFPNKQIMIIDGDAPNDAIALQYYKNKGIA